MNTILSVHRSIALAALVCLFCLTGCGGEKKPDEEGRVRATLKTFVTSIEKRDYQTLCDKVFAPELLEGLQSIGLPCELAMRNSFGEVKEPRLTVGAVKVTKNEATAEIKTSAEGQPPASNDIHLKKLEGDWRVSDLTERAPDETATPTPEGSATATPSATPGHAAPIPTPKSSATATPSATSEPAAPTATP
jgi:hypothetical protein